MSTVIYLANQQIQVVTGNLSGKKIILDKCLVGDAPDGSIINGMIMDPESFVAFIRDFWTTNSLPKKNITLVVNSSKFVSKTIEMPNLPAKRTLEFIEREFSDIKREGEDVYGYVTIESNKTKRKVYGECVPQDMISDYREIFAEAGVFVSTIYSGDSSIISIINLLTANVAKTFVFQIADNMTLSTILWVNGSFYYLNSVRSFYEQGTEDYANDVARSISKIVQFMQANQIDYELELVMIAGLNPNDTNLYNNAFSQLGINTRVAMFEAGMFGISGKGAQNAGTCVRAMSGLLPRGKEQNYLKSLTDKKKKDKNQASMLKDLISVIIVGAVMLIALITFVMLRISKDKKLKDLTAYNESPDVIFDVAMYDQFVERNLYLASQYDAIKTLDKNLYTYPTGTSDVTEVVYDCAGKIVDITFQSFDADAGIIAFSASCESVDNINLFIKELLQRKEFYSVDYTGYTFNETTSLWDVHVTCILSESVGKKGEYYEIRDDGER